MSGLAALSERAGVAPIIGAFLAGMAMGEALPHRVHDLAHGDTELLVPFFLAGIGLRLNLEAFSSRSTLALAVLVLLAAILTKVVGCGLGALKHGRPVALRVGFGMIPRGEFCMVVVQAGLGLKVIPADTYGIVAFMAVGATLLTPPLLNWHSAELIQSSPKRNSLLGSVRAAVLTLLRNGNLHGHPHHRDCHVFD